MKHLHGAADALDRTSRAAVDAVEVRVEDRRARFELAERGTAAGRTSIA